MARRARNLAGGRWPGCGVRMIDLSLPGQVAFGFIRCCLFVRPTLERMSSRLW
jgi:hypothetical protein